MKKRYRALMKVTLLVATYPYEAEHDEQAWSFASQARIPEKNILEQLDCADYEVDTIEKIEDEDLSVEYTRRKK